MAYFCTSRENASKKRSYDAAFKLKAVSCAEQSTNSGAARKFGVDELNDAALE